MKPFDYYETTPIKRPTVNDYKTYYIYNDGQQIWEGSYDDYQNNPNVPFPKGFTFDSVFKEDEYKTQWDLYIEDRLRLTEEFKEDLFAEFSVSDHPKKDLCYKIACEITDVSTIENVYENFEILVDLIT
jgi:hypothetical protein